MKYLFYKLFYGLRFVLYGYINLSPSSLTLLKLNNRQRVLPQPPKAGTGTATEGAAVRPSRFAEPSPSIHSSNAPAHPRQTPYSGKPLPGEVTPSSIPSSISKS